MAVINRTAYNALIDDNGTGTTGSVVSKATIKDVLLDPIDTALAATPQGDVVGPAVSLAGRIATFNSTNGRLVADSGKTLGDVAADALAASLAASAISQVTTFTGTQNDFALTARCGTLFCNNASLLTFTGFAAGFAGQAVRIVSIGAGQVDLTNQGAGSAAANRMIQGVGGFRSLAPGTGSATIVYDAATARWRVTQHEQGAYLPVPYAAGNFAASAGTWVVDAGDIVTHTYYLRGSQLTVQFSAITTTVTGLPSYLALTPPAGLTCASSGIAFGPSLLVNQGTVALIRTYTSVAPMLLIQAGNVAWPTVTNALTLDFSTTVEVR